MYVECNWFALSTSIVLDYEEILSAIFRVLSLQFYPIMD